MAEAGATTGAGDSLAGPTTPQHNAHNTSTTPFRTPQHNAQPPPLTFELTPPAAHSTSPTTGGSSRLLRTYSLPRDFLKQLHKQKEEETDDSEVQEGMKVFEARLQESLSPVGKFGEERRKRLARMMGKYSATDEGMDGSGVASSPLRVGGGDMTPRGGDGEVGTLSPIPGLAGDDTSDDPEVLRAKLSRARRKLLQTLDEKKQMEKELEDKEQENEALVGRVSDLSDEVEVLRTEHEEHKQAVLGLTPRRTAGGGNAGASNGGRGGASTRGVDTGGGVGNDADVGGEDQAEVVENLKEELSIMQDMMALKTDEIGRLKGKIRRLRAASTNGTGGENEAEVANDLDDTNTEEDKDERDDEGEDEQEDVEGQELFYNIQKGMKVKLMKEQIKQSEERLERWEKEAQKWKKKTTDSEAEVERLKSEKQAEQEARKAALEKDTAAAAAAAKELEDAREQIRIVRDEKEKRDAEQQATLVQVNKELAASKESTRALEEQLNVNKKELESSQRQAEATKKADQENEQAAAAASAAAKALEAEVARLRQEAEAYRHREEEAKAKELADLQVIRQQLQEAEEEKESMLRELVRKEEAERERAQKQALKKEKRKKRRDEELKQIQLEKERLEQLEIDLEERRQEDAKKRSADEQKRQEDQQQRQADEKRRHEEDRQRAQRAASEEQSRREREQRDREEEEKRIRVLKKQITKLEQKEKDRESELLAVREQLEKLKQELLEREQLVKVKEEQQTVEIQKEGRELIDATKESVDMALQFARDSEARIGNSTADGASEAEKQEAISRLKACSEEVMVSVKQAAINVHDVEKQHELADKQRAMGEAIHRVITLTADMGKKEIQEAVVAVAPQVSTPTTTTPRSSLTSTPATTTSKATTSTTSSTPATTASVMKSGQLVIEQIQAASRDTESTPQELVKPVYEKVTLFVRLLGDVASKASDPKFRNDLKQNCGVLKDRSIQLKILANVRSSTVRSAGEGFGGDASGHVAQAVLGLEKQVKDVLNDLAIASVKQRLRETLDQAHAIRRVIAAMQAHSS
eukprot:TRINITY_DN5719_c0_g1_i1.p1 TRINITY_DN5719_c0_g1~~TRINITY_DN5719_c0_g1_i1.p1  ORF type:complete len:1088 (+),score=350.59 TRINITY_DN5719_c0_g1_i1:134-3265(+)